MKTHAKYMHAKTVVSVASCCLKLARRAAGKTDGSLTGAAVAAGAVPEAGFSLPCASSRTKTLRSTRIRML